MHKLTKFLLAHYGMSTTNNSSKLLQEWILLHVRQATINNWRSFAWCSVVLIEALKSTNYQGILPDAWVDSWLHFGNKVEINKCQLGDVIIIGDNLKRTHVTTFVRYSTDGLLVYCLGGNQGGALQITAFDIRLVYKVIRFDNL